VKVVVSASSHRVIHPPVEHQALMHAPIVGGAVAVGMPEPQEGTPGELRQAYDLAYLSGSRGSGATVAVVEAYGDPRAEADLAVYRSSFGLSPCATSNGCFRKIDQNGGVNYPAADERWATETASDVDAVSALCPRCRILLVEANTSMSGDLAAAQAQAAQLGATQISDSWALSPTPIGAAAALQNRFSFPGIATVAASGDDGYTGAVSYPAALPDVTAAGGTTLLPASSTRTQNPRGFTESAWSASGSGCDPDVPKPSWQSSAGCGGRAYNDLSVSADPTAHPLRVYASSAGGWIKTGGTSVSAPLIAAYYAITGALASTPAWAYQHAWLLNDPATGANGSCAPAIRDLCTAGRGYDGPTGAGSISGAVVPGAPGIGGPAVSGTYTRSVTARSAQLQGGVYRNSSPTAYWWQYGTTSRYGHQTRAQRIGSGTVAVPVAGSLPALRPSTTYHYRLVARNGYGVTYGYDFALRT
jgi:hypothetical protein